jgi:ADP-ribose pyrophosphatase YjhB (NUDIX family)
MSTTVPILTAGVVIISNKEVLLIRHGAPTRYSPATYGIPIGPIQKNESPQAAASRALYEETGLRVYPEQLIELPTIYTAKLISKNSRSKIIHLTIFTCRGFDGDLRLGEATEPEWIPLEKLSTLQLLPNTEKIIVDCSHKNLVN